MEIRTEFNLKENIEIWKKELALSSSMTWDNINELESHLNDEIHILQKLGLSLEESLLLAKNRIGNIQELTTEYSKVNTKVHFRKRITPYLKGVLLFIAFITITELLASFSALIATNVGLLGRDLNLISIGFLFFSTVILGMFFYKKYRNGSFKMPKLTNIPILVSTIIFSKLLIYLSFPLLTHSLGVSGFRVLQMNFSIYTLIFGFFILTVSCIVFYSSRRENKMKIAQ